METKPTPQNIDEYIAGFPENVQALMHQLRETINKAAPDAKEKISWGMATFTQNGNLIHFAGHTNHIGIYPGLEAMEVFKDKLTSFKTSKGGIQFPYNKPIPFDLVTEIVSLNIKLRKKEKEEKEKKKKG